MNTNDPKFEAMIGDPEFQKLEESQQNQLVDEYKHHVMGQIPPSGNFMENAVQSSQKFLHGANVARDAFMNTAAAGVPGNIERGMNSIFPMSPQEQQLSQKWGINPGLTQPENGMERFGQMAGNVGGFMMGAPGAAMGGIENMMGKAPNFLQKVIGRGIAGAAGGYLAGGDEPQREQGATIGTFANPIMGMGVDAFRGVKNFFSTEGINQNLSNLENRYKGDVGDIEGQMGETASESERLKNIQGYLGERGEREVGRVSQQAKDLKNQFDAEGNSYAYTSKRGIDQTVDTRFEDATQRYNDMLENADPKGMTSRDLLKPLDKTIENKGILGREIKDPAELRLLAVRNRIASNIPADVETQEVRDPLTNEVTREGGTQQGKAPSIDDIISLKNHKNEVFNATKARGDLNHEFLTNYYDMLKSKGLEGFEDANNAYHDAYDTYHNTRDLTEPRFSQNVRGKMPPEEYFDLQKVEKEAGTNYLEKGKSLREKYQSQQQDLINKKSDISRNYGFSQNDLEGKIGDLETHLRDLESVHERLGENFESSKEPLNNQLQKLMGRQKAAKGLGYTALGTGVSYETYRLIKGIHDLITGGNNTNSQRLFPQ